jgi:hypothetical protein
MNKNNSNNNDNDNDNNKLRTIELSTNVNDYDTGEPILEGSIRKTSITQKDLKSDSPLYYELYHVKVGKKYRLHKNRIDNPLINILTTDYI